MKKPGVKPKGKRALTKAEQQQRVRARLRIINEEMEKVGLKPIAVHMPPIYLQAVRAFEESFQSKPNMIDVVVLSSGWVCKVVEDFIKDQVELFPDSETARIFNSPDWVSCKSIDFQIAAINAKIAIHDFEEKHEKGINQ